MTHEPMTKGRLEGIRKRLEVLGDDGDAWHAGTMAEGGTAPEFRATPCTFATADRDSRGGILVHLLDDDGRPAVSVLVSASEPLLVRCTSLAEPSPGAKVFRRLAFLSGAKRDLRDVLLELDATYARIRTVRDFIVAERKKPLDGPGGHDVRGRLLEELATLLGMPVAP